MIRIVFYNDFGEMLFDKDKWHLTEAEGLAVPTKMISTARYINQPGQRTVYSSENPRTITLSGDINLKKNGSGMFSDACDVLSKDGILRVETEHFTRQINARCIEFVPGARNGPYRSFVVQFLCDIPFFEDTDFTDTVIYERVSLLSKDTVLPAVFSTRIAKGDVFYPGTAFAEPIIYLSIPEGIGTISITNSTTEGKVAVEYDGSKFSKLIIDVENRTITDENGVSRIDTLSDESFFDGFYLQSGDNRIEVINSDVSVDVEARMKYKIRYQEAVI